MSTKLLKFLAAGSMILSLTMESFSADYTAHEWGTFTSVQGGNGELLPWRPLKTSELPDFVYNWSKPGLNRFASTMFVGKGDMVTLQRMETPVIYFYSDKQMMNVDVSVAFPKGLITEWYPQASQIGPSLPGDTNAPSGAIAESRAVWKNVMITPASLTTYPLPQDKSGNHYFAARVTTADFVTATTPLTYYTSEEPEKFIFYRGAGSFKTPLRVSATNGIVFAENTGKEKLSHLFYLSIHKDFGMARCDTVDSLSPNGSTNWPDLLYNTVGWQPMNTNFQNEVAAKMEAALVSEGLFADEARAMVNTWKDSWFTEEGVRVLYILPRAWTDETLPLTLNPKPENLVRVMVGRAEVITPNAEMNLFQVLTKAQNGDADARLQATADLKKLGRFAMPALTLANNHASGTNVLTLGYELLYTTTPSKFK